MKFLWRDARLSHFVGAIISLPVAAHGEPVKTDGLAGRIDQVVRPYTDFDAFSGVVLIAQGDKILLSKSYGLANDELNVPLASNSKFRIASLSKQFTLAALARLIDHKKLSLNNRLSDFLPAFPRANEITIEHLAKHKSGIAHTNDLPEFDDMIRTDIATNLAILAKKPLDFDPGTQTNYSNGGYDVLAAVIEKAAGEPFEAYLKRAVLKPLGLRSTGFLHSYQVVPELVDGYGPAPDVKARARSRAYFSELRIGGGALYSTVEDVWTLFRAATTGKLASPETTKALFPTFGQVTGRSPGFTSTVFIDSKSDLFVVSLSNQYAAPDGWGERLRRAAVGEPYELTSLMVSPCKPDPKTVKAHLGAYFFGDNPVRLFLDGDGDLVFFDIENDWQAALIPLTDGSYFHPFFDVTCRFDAPDEAQPFSCRSTVIESDMKLEFTREPA